VFHLEDKVKISHGPLTSAIYLLNMLSTANHLAIWNDFRLRGVQAVGEEVCAAIATKERGQLWCVPEACICSGYSKNGL
jgi:hypothetical protein